MKIISPNDCGNAPKKKVLNELIIAMAGRNIEEVMPVLAEDVSWQVAGGRLLAGKEETAEFVSAFPAIAELEILTIITHGKTAAANGRILTEKGVLHEFCHVFLFVSAGKHTIREITTYGSFRQDGNPAS
ncbi:nuclear transport factor 2 family protein [Bhargavaea ginsengi]|uniref:nuclear transport factor 2 family protein n=1 Tax=Bhargavaea ginsengi TaxID=426757 RepID=UPI002041B592|nr:nuclear transport factor 2 family protein [Bhargavaea ginsengi]MCM3087575.1 nuclear transport factor 2 family protein [Bhargavaea ginsengi]